MAKVRLGDIEEQYGYDWTGADSYRNSTIDDNGILPEFGWRIVKPGELLTVGDEFLLNGLWTPVDPRYLKAWVGCVRRAQDSLTRRPVLPVPAAETYWRCVSARPHKCMPEETRCPICWALFGQTIDEFSAK